MAARDANFSGLLAGHPRGRTKRPDEGKAVGCVPLTALLFVEIGETLGPPRLSRHPCHFQCASLSRHDALS
jgi:hypothetical protein